MTADQQRTLWKFARGDLAAEQFEPWLYAQTGLEELLGEELRGALLFADYRNRDETWSVRQRLGEALRVRQSCECPGLKDLSIVAMTGEGLDTAVFSTLDTVRNHGDDLWWLYMSKCRVCDQEWLVAQEERIYDDFLLKRLDRIEADAIIEQGEWPDTFITYERVLEIGRALSQPCAFLDPRSPSLASTAEDLRRERPGITDEEIANLVGITPSAVRRLA